MAITRLVGEGRQQVDVPVGERSGLLAIDHDHANRGADAKNGDCEQAPVAGPRGERAAVLRIQHDVGNLRGGPSEDGPARDVRRGRRHWGLQGHGRLLLLGEIVVRGDMHERAVVAEDRAPAGVAQPNGTLHDRVEDRLDVGRRARDDTEDLARRCLLLQGLCLALQRLRQVLLAHPRAFPLPWLGGERTLAFTFRFCRLCTPTHRDLLTFPQEPLADSWHALLQLLQCHLEQRSDLRVALPPGRGLPLPAPGRPAPAGADLLAGVDRDLPADGA